tara:strand:- start:1361 stop:1663 length:303 start_codon:yes stop_codon:yes gene_type:complete
MLKEYSERCLQHEAIIKKQKFNEIKFIYAVHKYDSMLEYNTSDYFKTEEEARKVFNDTFSKLEQEIQDNNLEVYNQTENEIYFEGLESSELLKIEAIIIP